jgi:hypothetical protein
MCNIILWCVHVTVLQWKHNIFCVGVVEMHFTVTCIKILIVAQQCSYGKFMSLTTMQIICTSFWNKLYSNYFALFLHFTYKH